MIPAHREKDEAAPDTKVRDQILAALGRLEWAKLDYARQLDLVRVYQVVLNRFPRPDDAAIAQLAAKFDQHYPAKGRELNTELAQLICFFQVPDAAAKTLALLEKALTQEEQIQYASDLRVLTSGWTPELRKAYFSWFPKAAGYKGGNSFRGFMNNIKKDAIAHLSDAEKKEYEPLYDAKPAESTETAVVANRPHVKDWTLDELVSLVSPTALKGRDYDRGRTLFAATRCFACHRFADEGGGIGPGSLGRGRPL